MTLPELVAPEIADHYPGHQPLTLIPFKTSEIKRLLGIDVSIGRITSILESLDASEPSSN